MDTHVERDPQFQQTTPWSLVELLQQRCKPLFELGVGHMKLETLELRQFPQYKGIVVVPETTAAKLQSTKGLEGTDALQEGGSDYPVRLKVSGP